MYVGSLFSGIGGIELGFERAGFKTKWFIEKDEYACKVLDKNFPDAVIYDDIKKVDFKSIPKVSILTGGFPCQDISMAGKGIGIKGSRSSLWKYYDQAIRILRPKYAFIENVSAITRRGLNVVLADIASIGYDAEWYCVSASAIGAPHQRDRTFIMAYLPKQGIGRLSIQQRNQGAKDINSDGKGKNVSNSESTREMSVQQQGQGNGTIKNGEDVSYTNSSRSINKGFDSNRIDKNDEEKTKEWEREQGIGVKFKNSINGGAWWSSEPRLGRVANGVSNRVDRIRCLGNSVVPQLAEVFANAIKEMES